ncbi:putative MFS family arabinose efflux permease [Neobacillus bataviensis]|uniref:Putative MFS family arabinose efflux permease n=1 Tax=Neobacillus bataviensis TaxID=220685 RepID=A0A561DCR5_9BACI|nr:MFS transporter [Neobacillus bataviensis]TWE01133.1 putative MFS family arabinose efflux permease [Neobacillus bataviensis]
MKADENMETINHTKKGYFMMAVLWLAYVTFAMNWVAGSSLTPQITETFFGGPVDPIISQLVNYSITTARVFANILAAIVLMKLGPRKAAGTAIGLLMMGLVAIYLPNYWAYTVARMVMAVGGSMVIVYMNPIVAHYVKNSKTKLRINAANTVAYNAGAFIVAVLFTVFAKQMVANWRVTLTFFASLTILFFIGWLWKAENFETKETGEKTESYGYKDALKDGFLWRYGLAFASFLTLYVLSLVSFKAIFDQYTLLNGSVTNLLISGFGILGTFAGISIGNKGVPRKPTLLFSGIVMVGTFALAIVFANKIPLLSYTLISISGFAMYIQYPIFLNLPHELKGMTPQRLTIMFGLFWAIAYAGQTIATIIWSFILGSSGYTPAMIFFIAASSLYIFLVATFPETRQREAAARKAA